MSPDVDFTLTEDAYGRFESLLEEQDVTVSPFRKVSEEDLQNGYTTYRVYGELRQGPYEFPYTLSKSRQGFRLTVEPFGQRPGASEAILTALGRAFPQPERGIWHQPQPERKAAPGSFFQNYGCLFIILFLVAVLVFAVIGVVSLFR